MMVQTGWLSDLRCAECDAASIASIAPGSDPPLVLDMFVEYRGEPMRAWCLACATRHGWLADAA